MLGDPCVVSVVLWVIPLLITCAKLPVKCQIYFKIFSFFFSRVRTHKYVNQNGKPYNYFIIPAIKQYGNLKFKIFETSAYLFAYIFICFLCGNSNTYRVFFNLVHGGKNHLQLVLF